VGKPVAGEFVVLPFPQTNLQQGKRRPALGVVDFPGDDLILCQITSQLRRDSYSVSLEKQDFQSGQLNVRSYIRPKTPLALYMNGCMIRRNSSHNI
jgi:mRNA interferase MazF